MHFTFWWRTNWYNSDRCIPSRYSYPLRDHLTHCLHPLAHIYRNCRGWVICPIYLLLHRHHLRPFPHYMEHPIHTQLIELVFTTLMIPTVPAYTLHAPSSFPTAANLPGSYFGVGRGFGTQAHGHSSQPRLTLTPDDDDERSECNSGVVIGVAGSGGTRWI